MDTAAVFSIGVVIKPCVSILSTVYTVDIFGSLIDLPSNVIVVSVSSFTTVLNAEYCDNALSFTEPLNCISPPVYKSVSLSALIVIGLTLVSTSYPGSFTNLLEALNNPFFTYLRVEIRRGS